jgi:lipid-A-disaccharide synthase
MTRNPEFLIVAGEVSGDMHAASLIRALKGHFPGARVYGIGGERLRALGAETLYDVKDMAVMGFTEVLRRLPFFRKAFHDVLALALQRRPDAVILVDYPGFNLRLAAKTHAAGLKTIYYICPQVWAWNRQRIPKMASIVDLLLAIFPFEKQVFAGTPLRVEFVGHPLIDEIHEALAEPLQDLPWTGAPRIALLPGSRTQEIRRILPCLCEAAALIERQHPTASFLIPTPSAESEHLVRTTLATLPVKPSRLAVVTGQTRQVLRQARAALVTSGTATLESALLGCPTVVVYRTSPLTYLLGKHLVRVPHIGIVNVIAGKRISPEFIQESATPTNLAAALIPLLDDAPPRRTMLQGFAEVKALLGHGGAATQAANLIARELKEHAPCPHSD